MTSTDRHLDYSGARGSNTGDEFHELWAARQALRLLDPNSAITALTVEGLTAEDETGAVWDGVDCGLFYGGYNAADANRVEIQQLKYSAADPNAPWTVSRLSSGRNGNVSGSPIRRLATAYQGLIRARGHSPVSDITVMLVTNQPIASELLEVCEHARQHVPDEYQQTWKVGGNPLHRLVHASGLSPSQFQGFAHTFDLRGSSGSRFAIEDEMLKAIAEWTDTELREAANRLRDYIRKRMLPEAAGELIIRENVLIQVGGVSDERALFPCPSAIRQPTNPVPRAAAQVVIGRINAGKQHICLHGGGGVGKTTVLREIEASLPDGSLMIIFDCYGAGSYLDASELRHRASDAFVQLSNDLALRIRLPLLLDPTSVRDHARAFRRRLDLASATLAAAEPSALIVVAIDAADNSITAALTRSPPERSFVHDLMSFTDLSRNVHLLVTARTGRLFELQLPRHFEPVPLLPFDRPETNLYVNHFWPAPETWIDDFHHLSEGVPRVQAYAFDIAVADPQNAIEALRPRGKKLDQVFREQFTLALVKAGREADLEQVCAGLIALPRPVPLSELSAVLNESESRVADICSDLAPGVRRHGGSLSFADEDFEAFVRQEASQALPLLQTQTADRFLARFQSDPYAALNVAPALLAANRRKELLDLAEREPEPDPLLMSDPVRRREVQLQRLQAAIRVCREAVDPARALRFVLIGAEAINTDSAIRTLLAENPGLTARHAKESASRLILGEAEMIASHGPLLLHLLAENAARGDGISVREGRRRLDAWMQARIDAYKVDNLKFGHARAWEISEYDVAASLYAELLISTPANAIARYAGIRPRRFAINVARVLVERLMAEGRCGVVESLAAELDDLRGVFLRVPLAVAGRKIDVDRLRDGISALKRRYPLDARALRGSSYGEGQTGSFVIDTALTAAEILVVRGGDRTVPREIIRPFLDPELRRIDRRYDSEGPLLDAILRAVCLNGALNGQDSKAAQVFTARPPLELTTKKKRKSSGDADQHDRELSELIDKFLPLYIMRAQVFAGQVAVTDLSLRIHEATEPLRGESWRHDRSPSFAHLRSQAAIRITVLLAAGADPHLVMDRAVVVRRGWAPYWVAGFEALFIRLASVQTLHADLLNAIVAVAREIKRDRVGAEEKSKNLAAVAKLLALISPSDAEAVFKWAIDVASELDSEVMDQIRFLSTLVDRGLPSFGQGRQPAAVDISEVVHDAGIRLQNVEHFPWATAFNALGKLDLPTALACAARWDDARVVGLEMSLAAICNAGMATGSLSVAQVLTLFCLLEDPGDKAITHLFGAADGEGNRVASTISDEVARDVLTDRVGRSEARIAFVERYIDGAWSKRLIEQKAFEAALPDAHSDLSRPSSPSTSQFHSLVASYDWSLEELTCPERLVSSINDLLQRSRAAGEYISADHLLAAARAKVPAGHRVDHLRALAKLPPTLAPDDTTLALLSAAEDWSSSPAVSDWCSENLPKLVVERLPGLARYLCWGDKRLLRAITLALLSEAQIQATLLIGVEQHADLLSAATTFALAGIIGSKLTSKEAADLCVWYGQRLKGRVDSADLDSPPVVTFAAEGNESVGRFIYAFLGDVDVRLRWRAAHAVRRLARLGARETILELVKQYKRLEEPAFRDSAAPFYWMSARLWLLIALDRMASEAPVVAADHCQFLFEIALNQSFPHVLIRDYAADACRKLFEARILSLTQSQQLALSVANQTRLTRAERKPGYGRSFDHFQNRKSKVRRFYFDSLDTLPYWYDPWLRVFDDLDRDTFLDLAEHWIVDKWGFHDEAPYGSKEPRSAYFNDRNWGLSSHRHGSLPILERHRNYLEWHAMWCTVGQLLETHALAAEEYEGVDELRYQISDGKLTEPPVWLADLVCPIPLEQRYKRRPARDIAEWVQSVSDIEFFDELNPTEHPDYLVVNAHVDVRSRSFRETARVSTGLVSPETAHALVRALQTVEVSSDYYICPEGHELEIDEGEYVLRGWIRSNDGDSRLDRGDVFRNGARRIEWVPGAAAISALGLKRIFDPNAQWIREGRDKPSFIYEVWGERERFDGRERRYGEDVISSGYRLLIYREDLAEFLGSQTLDLIAEVGITRHDGGNTRSSNDEEDAKENEFDRLLLFRRDGSVQAAERDIGTWRPYRPGAGIGAEREHARTLDGSPLGGAYP